MSEYPITIRRRDVEAYGPYIDYNRRGSVDKRRRVASSKFPFDKLKPGDRFVIRLGEKRDENKQRKLRTEIKQAAARFGIHVIVNHYYEIDHWVLLTTHDGEVK